MISGVNVISRKASVASLNRAGGPGGAQSHSAWDLGGRAPKEILRL